MLVHNLKQFGIGSAFFMFVLLATGVAKAISTPTVMVASAEVAIEEVSSN